MKNSEKLIRTLNFNNMHGGGPAIETFFPWTLTIERWNTEGLPEQFSALNLYPKPVMRYQRYLNDLMTESVYKYEQFLELDGVKRMSFRIPFKCFDVTILEETNEYQLRQDEDGWIRKYYKNRSLVEDKKPVVSNRKDWMGLKERVMQELAEFCKEENIKNVYEKYGRDKNRNDYTIRFRISGFFWTLRELFGDEEQMYAYYDEPELLKEINDFVLNIYKVYLNRIFNYIQPEVILIEEDLSGSTGPMISIDTFNEFVGRYYKELVPFLKRKGAANIFVDTDGDFRMLIPSMLESGIDGFLPIDVNAGMDIVKMREEFPEVKLIGGFNKMKIAQGEEAINLEFERLLPVIRQGGYIPGADHQVAPNTSLENYCYYIQQLKEVMKQAGADSSQT